MGKILQKIAMYGVERTKDAYSSMYKDMVRIARKLRFAKFYVYGSTNSYLTLLHS